MNYNPAWHLKGKPYPVQVEALKRCHGKKKYGWWLSQGLGKTALALNDWIENFGDVNTVVVVCPNSFKSSWIEAPYEWGLDQIETTMWPRDALKHGTPDKPCLNVINFEAVRSTGGERVQALLDSRPCLLVVDESSYIKNYKSQTAKSILDLSKRAAGVRLLNGTPLVQNVMDLFPQLKAIGELDGVNPYVFRNRYAVVGGYMGKQIVGVKNEKELHAIQERCSIRATKDEWWADAPEKVWPNLPLQMTTKQEKHYREMLEDFYTLLDKHEFTADLVLVQSDKLRQVSSGLLLDGDKMALIEPIEKNPKAIASLDLMESGDGKMITVYFYKAMGDALFSLYKKEGLNPAYIKGSMKPEELAEQKNKFNNDPTCRILVGQIGATAMGHTLIAGEGRDRCHRMFFHDLSFNQRDMLQVQDRIHRGEQDRMCMYFAPVMSPIDRAQLYAMEKKSDLATAVVDAVRALRRTRSNA